jgi:hypothetical protein
MERLSPVALQRGLPFPLHGKAKPRCFAKGVTTFCVVSFISSNFTPLLKCSGEDIKTKIKLAERKGYCYIITIGRREAANMANIQNSLDPAPMNEMSVAVRKNEVVTNIIVSDLLTELEKGFKLKKPIWYFYISWFISIVYISRQSLLEIDIEFDQ